ncbi:MAG: CotH kinase family protein, partial [Bacteroidetes bacterium]|nr:CotH kinase family protein [Bacteroidota bacterium]
MKNSLRILFAIQLAVFSLRAQTFTSSNLPIIVINTNGQKIVDEPKINVDLKIIYNGEGKRNTLTDTVYNYNGKAGIEIRGSSSQMFPKKQYGFETRDTAGEDLKVSLLGFPSESDWIFFAPYNDKSLLRDALTYSLARSMGRYATRSRYCELVLNKEYMGIYVLFEKIKRDKNRVNVSKLESSDSTGDALTGGYILKIDKLDGSGNDGFPSPHESFPGAKSQVMYQYHYPKPENITGAQKTYIKSWILTFEGAMQNSTYADSLLGYRKYLDVPSLIDYCIINELTKNVDGYRLSTFMYKDKDTKNTKMFFGPVWDFNLGFGNCDYYSTSITSGWQYAFKNWGENEVFLPPFWWEKIYQDPAFINELKTRWITLRKNQFSLATVNEWIDSMTVLLDESQKRNFIKWPVLNQYVWPNAYVGGTYEKEISYLKSWIKNRFEWVDKELTGAIVEVERQSEVRPLKFS